MRLEDVKGNYLKKNMHWLWTDVLNFSCSWYLSKLRLCLRWLHVMWNIINYNSLFPCHFNHLLRFHLRLQAISWRWESSVGKKAGGNWNAIPLQWTRTAIAFRFSAEKRPGRGKELRRLIKARKKILKWQGLLPCFKFLIFSRYSVT